MPSLALLLFYLIAPPRDTRICVLWLSRPATSADVAAACGPISLEQYIVDFVALYDGRTYCRTGASAVFAPGLACNLPGTLDQFKMDIIAPGVNEVLLCAVRSYNNPPTRAEVDAACDWDALQAYDTGAATLRLIGPAAPPITPVNACGIESPAPGPGLYDQARAIDDLRTARPLTWLASRLVWYGQNAPVDQWQNQFDGEIFIAATTEGVPARLLKRVISVESQFWPLWDDRPAGEIGMAQITAAGADQYLRWYAPNYGYASLEEQAALQAEFLRSLRCDGCSLYDAIQQERRNIFYYARILRAYRCSSPDWRAALVLWNGEPYTQKVENGG